jgi:hypothetical protein
VMVVTRMRFTRAYSPEALSMTARLPTANEQGR